tara:strand:- start:758 stop:1090 length:333 start_codon:yes stop_codon:yes gene_type:complete
MKITQMSRLTEDGFVIVVNWKLEMVNEGYMAARSGTVSFDKADGISFVPYESLTEPDVVKWVEAELGEAKIAQLQLDMLNQIKEMKAPKTAVGMPWAPSTVLVPPPLRMS